jgi:hypothetical protein
LNISPADLTAQHQRRSFLWRRALSRAAKPAPHVDVALLEAVSSRESNMRNITGDGGHGRGTFQQDDRFQEAFLRACRGCRSGSSVPIYASAWPKGRVPTVSAGARRAVAIIEHNVSEAKRLGIPDGHRTHFALAAYNAGVGGALVGWRDRHDPDANTAGHDYGRDVMERAELLRRLK